MTENFDEIYAELFAAIRESPGMAQETVDTLQRIIIGKEQVHVCAHCEQLFTADDAPAHMMTCEKNPVVLENKRLRRLASDILVFIEEHGSRELKAHATTLLDFRARLFECAKPTPTHKEIL